MRGRFTLLATALLAAAQLAGQKEAVSTPGHIAVDYPPNHAVFPPDFAPPTFIWRDPAADRWIITVRFATGGEALRLAVAGKPLHIGEIDSRAIGPTNKLPVLTPEQADSRTWLPEVEVWKEIKQRSVESAATLEFDGMRGDSPAVVSRGEVMLETSRDPVGAPVFFRDVPLRPSEVQKGVIKPLDPSALPLIAWRLRYVDETSSRLLLTGLHTCANCHSFSRDGKVLGMDVDGPENDKGTYAIAPIKPQMSIGVSDVITWNSFKDKLPGLNTLGFLSQVSPDGRYTVSTVNEQVYVQNFKDYRFLQVFYPTRGIIAWYDRETAEMKALPGADDPRYVQTDAVWTPDGKYLVFARAEARDAYPPGRKVAEYAGDPNEIPIQYDLYRVPFNAGKGGRPEPIRGAFQNGMSNNFPKVSPDGRWIVFVQCHNGQLMRPDGRLFIIPAEGGEARELSSNTPLMNSWHSFSPNGRWLVFSSKSRSVYTEMFLTHLDQQGRATPAILVENATAANRAVNIPEFVNIGRDALLHIDVPAADFYTLFDDALSLESSGRHADAVAEWRKALTMDPINPKAHTNLGIALLGAGAPQEALAEFRKAVEIQPDYAQARNNLGAALVQLGRYEEAASELRALLITSPEFAEARVNLGEALLDAGKLDDAVAQLQKVIAANPAQARVRDYLGQALARQGKLTEADDQWNRAIEADPKDNTARLFLGGALYQQGKVADAIARWREGLAQNPNDVPLLGQIAWVLATGPDAALRNGTEALSLAQRAVELSKGGDPAILDVLAAAYAESGNYAKASETDRRALELTTKQNQAGLSRTLQDRIALYDSGKPFRMRQ
jgi:tetratricopeptide (TPR) repeat protein